MPNPLIGRTLPSHPNRPRCRPRLVLLAASGLAGLLAGAPAARAALILSGNSTGSTLSNCVNVTGTPCGSTGTVTSLGLDSFTLSISTALNPFNVSTPPTTTTGVGLAELEMVTGNGPSGSASFNYNLHLNFTTPSGMFSQTIPIAMTASGNGSNSVETLSGFPSSLTGFPSLPGVTVSNFAFVTAGGTVGSGNNTFSGGTWTVTRGGVTGPGGTAFLDLTATVTSTAPPPVPEPASLALLGTALAGAGLGVLGRRRRARS